MGGFNIGTALGWTSGSLILIQMIRGEEDASSDAWIESTLYLGAIISLFSGINAVLFNLTSIFEAAAGHKEHAMKSSLLQSIFVGVVQVVATVPAMFVVDLLGRRLLMMASMFAMGVGQALLFVYFLLEELWGDSLAPGLGWLPPVGLVLFIASFSVGPGPISMAMLGEIFSEDAKSVSAPAATIFDFILSFFVVWTYEYLAPVIALYVFFLVYAVCCFLGLVAIFFILPETKNRTFEEIQNILEGNAPHMAPLLFRS
ncbi:Facilitated trehalose transporter Tret1 [Gryllus bimaculatus]|nr:Facilitated trehalose transporter Tret1 [Gryllus bimaculatus]